MKTKTESFQLKWQHQFVETGQQPLSVLASRFVPLRMVESESQAQQVIKANCDTQEVSFYEWYKYKRNNGGWVWACYSLDMI